jgi:hypothetical protein
MQQKYDNTGTGSVHRGAAEITAAATFSVQ